MYTALHLNLPQDGVSATCLFLRKTRWAFIGLLAPELLVFVAWCQYRKARGLSKWIAQTLQEVCVGHPFEVTME